MSISVPITKRDFTKLSKLLQKQEKVVAIDHDSHIKLLLVSMELVKMGKWDIAEIVKGYE